MISIQKRLPGFQVVFEMPLVERARAILVLSLPKEWRSWRD